MRTAYLDTLHSLAKRDPNVISLVADNGLIVYDGFRKDFPGRYFNFGISEGNMVSAAAGMASCGKIPFCYTISAFLAYRSYEFIRDDVCFQNQNVKIVGIGSGTAYSTLGPSHHATEDIGLLRPLPNLTLFSPGSPMDVRNTVRAAHKIQGPVYIRLGTNREREIYTGEYDFAVGKAEVLSEGRDISIVVTGSIVAEVLEATDLLIQQGIHARVINAHTLKPFDRECIVAAAKETGAVYTVEDHTTIGGLGSIVADVLAESGISIKFKKIGLNGCFAKGYGTPGEVRKMNGLNAQEIHRAILENERKKYEVY